MAEEEEEECEWGERREGEHRAGKWRGGGGGE